MIPQLKNSASKMSKTLSTIALILAAAPFVAGHSWIEQMRNIDAKGNYIGEYGYPRGYIAKTDKGYDGDKSMNFNLPAAQGKAFIDNNTPLCHPGQTKPVQSQDKYPRLKTPPGGFVALRYMENGHVTEPVGRMLGKPDMGGTVFVYGTTEPKEDEKLATVIHWTKDGKGGNGQGKLLATQDFDDGRCYEMNSTPKSKQRAKESPNYALGQAVEGAPGNYAMFCETDVQIPETAEVGKPYTLYWVWQWNTKPGVDPGLPVGKDEWYTTCMDIDVASNGTASKEASAKFALVQQDAETAAVSNFAARTAKMTDIVKGEYGPIFSAQPSGGSGSGSGGLPASSKPTAVPSSKPTAAPSFNPTATPPASFTTLPSASRKPHSNSTHPSSTVLVSTGLAIPTLTDRPGAAPTQSSSGDDNVVTVTDIVQVTVTAPAVTVTVTATTASTPIESAPSGFTPGVARSIHYRNGAKFRSLFAA
ncbi:hypothetical protein CFE70_004545 [Pyrenophora teres f. teres 0-1]|nr:hypothetical protein HRS9139_05313 [Pyrenophora teres f. teres]KAE8840737.1 hypothetical protein PTNB85_04136 [Pyrenophora teres f. teres]KAE8849124.1 hypothetical protein HRS9122_03140 [Pyrenophora teres f. teres]KAE8864233.1 hypothetical protein PTNB29_04197 [Pyrenophora teres f. teres]CAE7032107.1 hypothetical protein PTTW11_04926 [Pyrenophora teres f. teres]